MNTPIANPADLAVDWVTSSYSGGNNNCVQTAELADGTTAVRDSKVAIGPALVFGAAAWAGFLDGVRQDAR